MNIQQIREEEIRKHKAFIAHADSFPQVINSVKDRINFISAGNPTTVFVDWVNTFDEVLEMIRGYKFNLNGYYEAHGCTLCINYDIDGLTYNFHVRDAEDALARVSGGKCHMEQVTRTEGVVMCDKK